MIGLDEHVEEVDNNSIENNEDFYILGRPIKTAIGDCHFLKVKDYPKLSSDLRAIALTKLHLLQAIKESNDVDEETLEQLEELSLFGLVVNIFPTILESYQKVFAHFFRDENALNRLQSEEDFEECRNIILKLSCIKEEKINPNPEIQRAINRSKRLKQQQSGGVSFSTIVTSVSTLARKSYREINEMTLFQLYMDFYRLSQKINYDTTTLFATASGKAEIDSWSEEIDMFEEEKHGITRSEFSKIAGVLSD